MAQKSQTGGTEKNGSSLPYCKRDFKEGALQWVTEPPQGRVLLVLSMDNTCPSSSFDMDLCAEKLQSLGVQVPADPWRRLLQEGVLRPEVRRYLFYSSRAFQIAMAVVRVPRAARPGTGVLVPTGGAGFGWGANPGSDAFLVFYISLWTNLYSTLQLSPLGRYWGASVLVTLVALAVTVLVILVIDHHQRKLNVNTDVRLAAVNEIFIKHSVILGITGVLDGPHNILQLWFVHFSPERCLQALAAHITQLQGTQAGLRHSLDQLCVVMDVVVQPELGREEEAPCEESPLLSSGGTLNKDPVTCNELLRLIPEGPPKAMAQQLLVIFSGCYVRLLVTGRLPRAGAGGHVEHSSLPCLCQFIQTTVLHSHHSWVRGR
ncbi:PREDICTED: transmembrane protein C9orf91 homolog isoform X1 [Corvus brachyrhynchos]|uniref:transmembrane protein C9orf91 homolog isoform X1 n=1 Tax=Corvus brachyrhynchos TaxID=85066 RepID=UPI000816411E|nr:PREDICTED: transmembrane protein C9orf91 homolog isoform X1 [Corvus brachyrhynchos]XP_017595830.1 PREDICTED: transmembrane protein C9orf91 homolog isoform X1 [Corvus brachyrhynchos]